MALRWKKLPKLTGLSRIGASPRGSMLHEGGRALATTNNRGMGWQREDVKGWYWSAPSNAELGIGHKNTCYNLVETEEEAKAEAKAYVLGCIKNKEEKKL